MLHPRQLSSCHCQPLVGVWYKRNGGRFACNQHRIQSGQLTCHVFQAARLASSQVCSEQGMWGRDELLVDNVWAVPTLPVAVKGLLSSHTCPVHPLETGTGSGASPATQTQQEALPTHLLALVFGGVPVGIGAGQGACVKGADVNQRGC